MSKFHKNSSSIFYQWHKVDLSHTVNETTTHEEFKGLVKQYKFDCYKCVNNAQAWWLDIDAYSRPRKIIFYIQNPEAAAIFKLKHGQF